jgi:hypothetical protein
MRVEATIKTGVRKVNGIVISNHASPWAETEINSNIEQNRTNRSRQENFFTWIASTMQVEVAIRIVYTGDTRPKLVCPQPLIGINSLFPRVGPVHPSN